MRNQWSAVDDPTSATMATMNTRAMTTAPIVAMVDPRGETSCTISSIDIKRATTESKPPTYPNVPTGPSIFVAPAAEKVVAIQEKRASIIAIDKIITRTTKFWCGVSHFGPFSLKGFGSWRTKTKPANAIAPKVPNTRVSC